MENQELRKILEERMKDPDFKRRSEELYDAIKAAIGYENKYRAMTNTQLADALINGPWADTPLFTESSELLEAVSDRLLDTTQADRITALEQMVARALEETDKEYCSFCGERVYEYDPMTDEFAIVGEHGATCWRRKARALLAQKDGEK